VVRAGQVQTWVQSGAYERIIGGEYVRRGSEADDRPLRDDVRVAAAHYRREFSDFADQLKTAAKQATDRARDAYNDARSKGAV
jgi:hypothetical protein